jgi:TatA/E family protein of Tat protein translocase
LFLFIFETIGTQELILIGVIALLIFGPRKLPQMARAIGKAMSEFRRAGAEFKSTWEREVALEEGEPGANSGDSRLLAFLEGNSPVENTIGRGVDSTNVDSTNVEQSIALPEVKEVKDFPAPEIAAVEELNKSTDRGKAENRKENWL